ncbi:xanthine dehydrogenase family protein subunit M [Azospirillum sp. RWY-5-1]|uniref:Xanthine dehydrogenase family protein subunit M n=1 Tax=Azospirillum oleiclasticum TaxID=2735135 RepID=A0ABX2TE66_9PROT|nr:FAD binding domain-containing protein [Azospirillum oleiclasticum]NYZ15520.1 xanthine dehydrogenase family protein subunit M [Azospirillum oleiclasticum]NYZ22543.1 xanthine dehydrogenase family protein subunit M [Azospirillum oleiclasticum]
MKAPPFDYHRPASLDEALGLLAGQPDARILAGGQSLVPMLNMRLAAPATLIDINRVDGLDRIEEGADRVTLGAMVRQRALEASPVVRRRLPLLAEAVAQIGHPVTRNRGTVGGSLCHLDPAAEIPAAALALDARLVAASARGTRRLAMEEFALGMMTTGLEPDEMLVAVELAAWPEGHGAGFAEFARRPGDFAMASAAALVALDGAGRVDAVRLVLGAVAATPLRVTEAEAMLMGRTPDTTLIAEAAALAGPCVTLEDPQAPLWYRARLATAMAKRALTAAVGRADRKRVAA